MQLVENERGPGESTAGQRTWGWRVNCAGGEWVVLIGCGLQGAWPMFEQEMPVEKTMFKMCNGHQWTSYCPKEQFRKDQSFCLGIAGSTRRSVKGTSLTLDANNAVDDNS